MTEQGQNGQESQKENNVSNKELNFRALESRYQKQLEQERNGRLEAERMAQEAISKQRNVQEEEDDDSEPYVDKKKLNKTLAKFGEQNQKITQNEIQKAVQHALQEERKQNWIKQNGDFYEVLGHAEKLALKDPELAESILEMPDTFERQKLVYKNIKALGLHQAHVKQPSIQDKVDSNRTGAFYQPSGVGSAPYASQGDFSDAGKKAAFEKTRQLKAKYGM